MNKEIYRFMCLNGVTSISFSFLGMALQWLYGTTTDDDGRETNNFILFGDLLASMAFTATEGKGFRRPLMLSAGQAQYSEDMLARNWHLGRKRVRNLLERMEAIGLIEIFPSRVASVMTFPCVDGWNTEENGFVRNPAYSKQREENGDG